MEGIITAIHSMNKTNLTSTKLSESLTNLGDELFELTWNEILYDGGLATWVPRSSFRWLTICVSLIGVLGNILATYTLLRPNMRTLSTYTYLTALCISNTVTLISVIVFEVDVLVEPNHFNCFIISISKACASTAFALSTWITVCFTIDRYIMICFPFIGEHKCTRRNAIYIIIICFIFSLTYLIPQLSAQKCHPIIQFSYHETITKENLTLINQSDLPLSMYWVSGLSETGKSLTYRLSVTLFFNCFLVRIIPFLVIFKLNFRLIQTLAHTKRRHRQLNPYEQKRIDVTYMLVIITSTYLVCIMPSIPFTAFFAYDPHHYVGVSFHYRIFQYLDEFTKFLTILNSALQCYLYIFFGQRFRRELTRFFCCLCVKYFYMSIPETYTNGDQEPLTPHIWNSNDASELVLQGEWLVDSQHSSIIGIEFSFHYARQSSHSSRLSETLLRLDSDDNRNQINLSLLKRSKTRVEQFFSRLI